MDDQTQHRFLIQSFEAYYAKKVVQITEMKQNHVFLVNTTHEQYVIKIFEDPILLRWQERFLNQMLEKQTKGVIPFVKNMEQSAINPLANSSSVYGVMPYIPGIPINWHNFKQVRDCMKLLSHFHVNGRGIYGKQQIIPFRSQLYMKWKERLQLFIHSLPPTEEPRRVDQSAFENERRGLSETIQIYAAEAIEWAQWTLSHFPQVFVLYLEEQAQWERQVAHLDVATHNFLSLEGSYYYLLDYDLVDYSPPLFDIIQFMNRLLNEYEWSFEFVDHLLSEYSFESPLSSMEYKIIPILLVYPGDLFREWLGIWKNKTGYHPQKMYHYLKQLESMWGYRRKFVQKCQSMIK